MMSQNGLSRDETDSLGTVSIPLQSLYGSNTVRALANFLLDDRVLGQELCLVQSLARIKKTCALANMNLGNLDQAIGPRRQRHRSVRREDCLSSFYVGPGRGGAQQNADATSEFSAQCWIERTAVAQ